MTRLPRPVGNDNERETMPTITAAVAVSVTLAAPAHAQVTHGTIAFGKNAGGKDAAYGRVGVGRRRTPPTRPDNLA